MPHGAIPYPFGQCRICNDKATGVHYGVATCEGCKGFFKRSIPKAEKYKCFFGSQCILSPKNRNRCKSCRFKQCVLMGMSVEAVKMGRIPKLEKERALKTERERKEIEALLALHDSGIDSNENSPLYVNLPPLTDTKLTPATTTANKAVPPTDVEMIAMAKLVTTTTATESGTSSGVPSRPNSSNSTDARQRYSSVLSSPAVIKQLLNQVLEANSTNGQSEMINKILHQVNTGGEASTSFTTSVNQHSSKSQPTATNHWPNNRMLHPISHEMTLAPPPPKIPHYQKTVADVHARNGNGNVPQSSLTRCQHHQQIACVCSQNKASAGTGMPRPQNELRYYNSGQAVPQIRIKEEPLANNPYCGGGGMNKLNDSAFLDGTNNMSGWSLSQIDRYLTDCVNEIPTGNLNGWNAASFDNNVVTIDQTLQQTYAATSNYNNLPTTTTAAMMTKDIFRRDHGEDDRKMQLFDGTVAILEVHDGLPPQCELEESSMDTSASAVAVVDDHQKEIEIPDVDTDTEIIIDHLRRCYLEAVSDYIEARDQLRAEITAGTHMDESKRLSTVQSTRSEIADVYSQLISAVTPCSTKISLFCQQIPGMSHLQAEDQATIIKHSFFDIWMVGASACFYDNECHILLPNKDKYCLHWMIHFLTKELIDLMLKFSAAMNSYMLSDRELALICVVRATLPDREGVSAKDEVKKLHSKYLNLMTQEIIQKHPENGGLILSGLFMTLPQLYNIARLQNEMIGNFQISQVPEDASEMQKKAIDDT